MADEHETSESSGLVRAAILMIYLGEEVSSEVFKKLTDDEIRLLSQEISKIGVVDEGLTHEVVRKTHGALVAKKPRRGSLEYAHKLINSAFSPDVAREYIRQIGLHSALNIEGLDMLQKADPVQLSMLLENEHPQTVALVASHLKPDLAGRIIALLGDDLRADVCVRLARMEKISQPVRDRVIGLIADKLDSSVPDDTGEAGGVRQVAEILNQMDQEMSRACLEQIETENPNMAVAIRNNMFVFEDLLIVNDREMRKIIQSVDKQVLVTALKGGSEDVKQHFFNNMSSRAGDMLKDDMETLGPIKKSDAEAAQLDVVTAVRELEEKGEIDLGGGGSDDYVS